jgi:hypothetical protein
MSGGFSLNDTLNAWPGDLIGKGAPSFRSLDHGVANLLGLTYNLTGPRRTGRSSFAGTTRRDASVTSHMPTTRCASLSMATP